ncbi:glycosyltransferase, group 1 family protein, partial [Toxoplasma gondii TgCatPRC2]
GFLCEHDAG